MSPNNPLIIAHRGEHSFKEKYPENTLIAFKGAIDAGVDALETDVQVTKDGVVVINHDPTTGRVYDKDLVVSEANLDELKELTNKADPNQKLLTFQELAEWFITQRDGIKIMLDIKPYNNKLILVKIIRDLLNVHNDLKFWYNKIIFGLWRLDFYEFGYLTGLIKNFEIINISISPTISQSLIDYSKTLPEGFKLNAISILDISSWSSDFEHYRNTVLKPANINLYLWTINTPENIKKSISIGVNGMVTDNPVEVAAQIRLYEEKGVLYKKPDILSMRNLKLNTLFVLFRVFEFIVVYKLNTFKTVQTIMGTFVKYVLNH